jgi:hypothetical protein
MVLDDVARLGRGHQRRREIASQEIDTSELGIHFRDFSENEEVR